jgi:hypothetical protein
VAELQVRPSMKPATPGNEIPETVEGSSAACPGCDAALDYDSQAVAYVDECGFESYRFRCGGCGVIVVGLVDPADQMLLLAIES